MYIPEQLNLVAIIGGTFDPVLTFSLDLTNYEALVVIGDMFSLESGTSGLTLGGLAGTVAPVLTDTQTASVSVCSLHWYLRLTDTTQPAGQGVGFPLNGEIEFQLP